MHTIFSGDATKNLFTFIVFSAITGKRDDKLSTFNVKGTKHALTFIVFSVNWASLVLTKVIIAFREASLLVKFGPFGVNTTNLELLRFTFVNERPDLELIIFGFDAEWRYLLLTKVPIATDLLAPVLTKVSIARDLSFCQQHL